MKLLNETYKAAWAKVSQGSFFYADPDKVEPAGAEINYPALFRLYRIQDTIINQPYRTELRRGENFLIALKVEDYPGSDEEQLENQVLELFKGFVKELKAVPGIGCDWPATISWQRRNLNNLCLCLAFSLTVECNDDLEC